jgi:zinc D-Ala-D-Ala carboxypeptidase
MSHTAAAPTTTRRTFRPTAVALLIVTAAIIGPLLYHSASSSPPSFSDVLPGDRGGTTTEADGALPDGVTVFDGQYPGVANLHPDLLHALREAATDAADDGVEFDVNSGWRSPKYQNQLLREAISKYGSEQEAARWVATADTSPHVSGDAVDIGPFDATAWLAEHGAAYGLCQIYSNEPWHYELRPAAINQHCPRRYADPTQDPRMQQQSVTHRAGVLCAESTAGPTGSSTPARRRWRTACRARPATTAAQSAAPLTVPFPTQHPLGAVVNRPPVWSDR